MNKIQVPEMPELEFDDQKHIYRLNGVVLPSVSTIIEPLTAIKYQGINSNTLDNAARKGTAIHNSIENFIKFGFEDVAPEYRTFFDAFLEWWNDKQPIVIASELRIYHKLLRYGGTLDLLAIIDDKVTLVDYKTTYEVSDMTCGVQLEGYAQALLSHGIKVEEKQILHLKKDAKHKVHKYPGADANRWRVFGSLKNVYDYIQSSR